jgi:hypothetical protein
MQINHTIPPQNNRARPGAMALSGILLLLFASVAVLSACAAQPDGAKTIQPATVKSPAPTHTATAPATMTFTPTAINSAGATGTAEDEEARMAVTIAAKLVATAAAAEATATAAQLELIAVDYDAQATATDQSQKIYKVMTVQAEVVFAGPLDGYLEAAAGKKPAPGSADVNLRNFVTRIRFAFRSPGDFVAGQSDENNQPAGFTLQFREGSDGFTALILYQDGRWELAIFDGQAITSKQEGQLLDLEPENWNDLALYVDEIRGFFFLNGTLISQLALDDTLHSGDVTVAMGKPTSTEPVGASIDYIDFTVWAMEPILPTPTPTPTLTPFPTITPATPQPPEGLGQITLINETEDRPLSVDLPDCPGYIGSVDAGQRIDCQIPEGPYSWRAWGWGCQFFLPHLNLVRGTFVTLRIIRSDGVCDYTLSLCVGDQCAMLEPVRIE